MEYILTPKGSKTVDDRCVSEFGLQPIQLMTNAAAGCASTLKQLIGTEESVVILCGGGNNGGDGFAIASMLQGDGYTVAVYSDADIEKMSDEAAHFYRTFQSTNPIQSLSELSSADEPDVVVDALIGTGGDEVLREPLPSILHHIAEWDCLRIAIDVPTGLNALTGATHQNVFRAHYTITMEGRKVGMCLPNGKDVCGDVYTVGIGAPRDLVHELAIAYALTDDEVVSWMPSNRVDASKFTHGRVVVIAGSSSMRGAAALTAEAVMRSGAGLCQLVTVDPHPMVLREVITHTMSRTQDGTISADSEEEILRYCSRADAVVVGPGLGNNNETLQMLARVISTLDASIPVVIDADALRCLPSVQRDLTNVVITPHHGEFQRLLPHVPDTNEHTTASELARRIGCVVHKKGVPSVTTNGSVEVWTLSGNPGMATAGSGDVLSGVIGGLLGQGMSPLRATALGSYLHASAGDVAATTVGERFMIAGDIITGLQHVLS